MSDLKKLEDAINEKEQKIAALKKKIIAEDNSSIVIAIFFLLFSLAVSSIGIFYLGKWWLNTDKSFGVGLLLFPFAILAIIWDIWLISITFNSTKKKIIKENKALNEEIEKLEEEKKNLLENKIPLEIKIQNRKKAREDDYQASLTTFNNNKQEQLIEITNLLGDITKEALLIYENLKTVSILDERDWQYVDVIIYEIETGRAESMKEALQQADLYNRHNELQEALANATAAICNTIHNNLSILTGHISREIGSLRESVSSLAYGQEKLSERLINSQEMTNALLSKQNETSESLAYDIIRIKEIQEREYYGIK